MLYPRIFGQVGIQKSNKLLALVSVRYRGGKKGFQSGPQRNDIKTIEDSLLAKSENIY